MTTYHPTDDAAHAAIARKAEDMAAQLGPEPHLLPADTNIHALLRDLGLTEADLDSLPVWLRLSAAESGVADFCERVDIDLPPPTLDVIPDEGDLEAAHVMRICLWKPSTFAPVVSRTVRVYRHLARSAETKLCWLYTTDEPPPLDLRGVVVKVVKPASS